MTTQILTENHLRGKEQIPDFEKLNRNSEIEKKNVVHDTATHKPCENMLSTNIIENTIDCNDAQVIENPENIQDKTENTDNINVNPWNITNIDYVKAPIHRKISLKEGGM